MIRRHPFAALVAALLAVIALAGCSDVTAPGTADGASADGARDADKRATERLRLPSDWLGPQLPPVATPQTPDALMEAFVSAHDTRDHDLLGRLLCADYQFVRQDGTPWSREVELSIYTKMMVGRAGLDGVVIGAMQIEMLQPLGTWSDVPANDPYFGAIDGVMSRPYALEAAYALQDQQLILQVSGPVTMYAVRGDDGVYRLAGMVDMTYGKTRTEEHSWTAVKALFE
jgi:hypothetical protein